VGFETSNSFKTRDELSQSKVVSSKVENAEKRFLYYEKPIIEKASIKLVTRTPKHLTPPHPYARILII
jgi:hypothetical protein